MSDPTSYKHFQGKDALHHLAEARAKGVASLSESHGTEIPGHISAAADAARETALVLLLLWSLLTLAGINETHLLLILGVFGLAWLVWKIGRSAWLGWSRLERLHRLIEEERWEIEHHRPQEREELSALYKIKGFSGQLLEEVLDVLMADNDRLLRIMLEEEMGLSLQAYEHPLKQALGAAVGSIAALIFCVGIYLAQTGYGMILSGFITLAVSGAVSAFYEKNQIIRAIIWNLAIGAVSLGTGYFIIQYLLHTQ